MQGMDYERLDRIEEQLLSVKASRPGTEVNLMEEDIVWLCRRCREVSANETNV